MTTVEFAVSDASAVGALQSRMAPISGLVVRRRSENSPPTELGAADILAAVGGGAALAAAINVLPDFFGSRRTGVKIRVKIRESEIEVNARNAAEAVELLQRMLGD